MIQESRNLLSSTKLIQKVVVSFPKKEPEDEVKKLIEEIFE